MYYCIDSLRRWTEIHLSDQQKSATFRRIASRLLDKYGRKSILREFRERFRPSLSNSLIDSAHDLKQFWESAHVSGAHLWISGTPPKEIYERLNIEKLISVKGLSILNVGVGEGYCEMDLVERGQLVDSLDVCDSAISKVKGYIRQGFLDAQDLPSRSYDLVIHHLVAQHMTHEDLREQLRQLLRALKSDGLLAMQFASSQSVAGLVVSDREEHVVMSGGVLRSKDFMKDLIESCSGSVMELFDKEAWTNSDCQYISAHITSNQS